MHPLSELELEQEVKQRKLSHPARPLASSRIPSTDLDAPLPRGQSCGASTLTSATAPLFLETRGSSEYGRSGDPNRCGLLLVLSILARIQVQLFYFSIRRSSKQRNSVVTIPILNSELLFSLSDSKFTQQELPACKLILTPKLVVSVFLLLGIIFVPIGIVALLAAENVVEITDRYDDECVPPNMIDNKLGYIQDDTIPKDCIRSLKVTKDMKQPIFVYYQLDGFYQNHRRYVKSRNDAQLRDPKKANQTMSCDPESTANGKPIVPCGLIAWSLFNDTYSFSRGNETLTVNKKDISWKSDRERKFAKNVYPSNFQNDALIGGKMLNASIPLSEQEDLIVWMRTAALPTFRKLYGRIYADLKANDKIIVRLSNNYNTYSFGGKKKLILSTATWLGGKNYFLGYAYLAVGGLCIFLGLAFTLLYEIKPRKMGDHKYMSWNRHLAGL